MRILLVFVLFFSVRCRQEFHEKNHLSGQRSSYLQESQNDQIWWYPWGELALKAAKSKDRMIFLSIGYSSCFACEKMQKEVFSQSDVAEILNKNFVSIKVDREDRPDLDAHFLNMQSLIMRFGAWPINMVLTPDLQPVFATTLTSKKKFLEILNKSSEAWTNQRNQILQGATRYQVQSTVQPSTEDLFTRDRKLIDDFYARYTHRFDSVYGGKSTGRNFNTKFPVNDEMRLLLRYHLRSGDQQPLKMVNKTMTTIVKSALFDQVQGGFHRYSSTRDWNTPNFEKMLYDQASFLHGLIDIYKIKKSEVYQKAIQKTVKFLLNQVQYSPGGFYSSFSGSLNGIDGAYYTWKTGELKKGLTPNEWKLFKEFYAFTRPYPKIQNQRGVRRKTSFFKNELEDLDKKIVNLRNKRGQLQIDKKIVTADNAYVLSALSKVHQMWPSEDLYNLVKSNLDFVINQHTSLSGKLYRRSIGGVVAEEAVLDDFAFLIDALIEFYQTSFEEKYLHLALALQTQQNRLFFNDNRTLFEFSQAKEEFLDRQFLFTDQSKPSGQAMSYWNLIRLSRFFNNIEFETMANKLIDSYPDLLKSDPMAFASILLALDFNLSKGKSLVIVGDKTSCHKFSREGFDGLQPYVLFSCDHRHSRIPLHVGKKMRDQKTTFYICDTRSCQEPTTDYQKALKLLN